jgi:hypothetical protein
MRKNFTRLISGLTQTKKSVIALTSLMILAGAVYLYAAVGVTTSASSPLTISADLAKNSTNPIGGGFTPVGTITIAEPGTGGNNDLGASNTIDITAPAGWEFYTEGTFPHGISVIGREVDNQPKTFTTTLTSVAPTKITFTYSGTASNKREELLISGIRIRAIDGASAPETVNVRVTSATAISGLPATAVTINHVAGTARRLAFGQQPTATDIYTVISPAPTVLVQDQFGNTVTNANNSISLAFDNNPGGGVLAGTTTVSAVNGVATFSNLSIDASGSNYRLIASSGLLTETKSAAFDINSTAPVLESIDANCFTIGTGEKVITLRGSNFARNATGRIGSSIRPTTFISPGELRMTLLETDIDVAGNKSVNVRNPAPSAAASSSIVVTVYHTVESVTPVGSKDVCTGNTVSYTLPSNFTDFVWSMTSGATLVSENDNVYRITFDDQPPASGKVTITVSAKNPCGIAGTQSFDVAVRQSPPNEITYDTPLIFCVGGSVVLKAPEAPAGEPAYTYQWRLGGAAIAGETSSTYTATAAGSYSVLITAENGCFVTPSESVGTTTALSQGDITGNTAYCQNATATALSATAAGGLNQGGSTSGRTKNYTWQQALSASGPWTVVQGPSTTASYVPSTADAGTFYYRRIVEAGGCEDITDPVTVTVTPAIENTLTSENQVVCSGDAIATIVGNFSGGEPGNVTYLWEQSPNGSNTWTEAVGTNTEASYTPAIENVTTSKTTYYRRKVESGNCTSYSNNASVRITARPVATITQGANTYFCPPGSATLTAASVTDASYAWYKVGEAASFDDARSTTVSEVGEYYVIVTANNCSSTSANITVQETVVGNNILNSLDQTVCYGATPDVLQGSEATSTLGSVSYQWQVKTMEEGSFSNISNATQVNLTLGAHTTDRWYRRRATVGSCSIYSDEIRISVKPELKVTNLPTTTPAICSNGVYTFTPEMSVSGATAAWTRAAVDGISNTTASGTGAINETLVNTTASPINVTYTYITSGNVDCEGVPQNLVVRVNPTPLLSSTLSPAAICSGAAFSYTATSATSGTSYSWVRQPADGITSGAAASGSTAGVNHVLTNATSDPIDVTYTYTLTANGCTNTQDVVVRVNPTPQLSSSLSPAAICSGSNFSYTATSATAGTTYNWTRLANTNINGGATSSGSTATINETLTSTNTGPVNVTYRYTLSANGCTSTQDVVVMVNPSPRLSSTLTPTAVCSGSTFVYNPTSATAGATFAWTRAAVTGISNPAVTTPVAGGVNETLVNTTTNAINVTYVYTTTANGCVGTPQNVTVSVSPNLAVSFTGLNDGDVLYTGQGAVALVGSPDGGTFSGPGVTNTTTGGSKPVTTTTFNPCTAGPGTHTITYTRTTGGCTSTVSKTVTVKQSTYTVIVEANPFPTCKGQRTDYTARVYRDVASVIYPYLVNSEGLAVDATGKRIGDQEWPVPNPDYPFPANTPKILFDNLYRYFQPIVTGGTLMDPALFDYKWTKNLQQFPGSNTSTIGNAGLSSLDYYAVLVTSKTGNCVTAINERLSNRMYTAAPINYEVVMNVDKETICVGGSVTMSADLNASFSFWGDIGLTLFWMHDRGGVITQLGQTDYKTGDSNPVQFTTTGPAGVLLDGDKLYVEFSSVIDQQSDVKNKCSKDFMTASIAITVVGEQTMNGGGAFCAGGVGVPVGIAGSQQNVFYQLKRDGANVGSPVAGTGSALSFGNQTVGGAYTVEALAATNTAGCLEFGPINVYVTELPIMQTLTAGNNGEYCAGGTGVPITLANSQTNVKYQLQRTVNGTTSNVGSEVIGSDGQPIPFGNQTEEGVYSVLATTLPTTGTVAACPQTMGGVTVTINPLPTVEVNSPTICEGSTATVTAEPTSGTGPFKYTWTVPSAWTGPVPTTASFQTTIPGAYTVSIEDSKSCVSSVAATSTVIVNELPTVTVNGSTVCAGADATVTAIPDGGVGPYTYTWTVPDGATNPGDVASFQTKVAGDYSVRIQDSRSCSSSQAATGTVTLTPMKLVEGKITAENENGPITEDNPIGADEMVTFTATAPVPAADITGYVWHKGSLETDSWTMVQTSLSNTYEMVPGSEEPFDLWVEVLTASSACYFPINIYTEQPIVPLPVELLYFNATKKGTDVVLEWATASELDNKGFEVQVSSDARNFRVLGFVESKVNTTTLKQLYSFVDKENGKQGVRYYRLKQIDLDGKYEIFNVRAVHFGEVTTSKVKAYPNPFQSEVELSIEAEVAGEMLIMVSNATGQELLRRTVQVSQGQNMEKITLDPTLPRGIYIVTIRMGELNSHFKLLKQ